MYTTLLKCNTVYSVLKRVLTKCIKHNEETIMYYAHMSRIEIFYASINKHFHISHSTNAEMLCWRLNFFLLFVVVPILTLCAVIFTMIRISQYQPSAVV